jgi:hypothetical protein
MHVASPSLWSAFPLLESHCWNLKKHFESTNTATNLNLRFVKERILRLRASTQPGQRPRTSHINASKISGAIIFFSKNLDYFVFPLRWIECVAREKETEGETRRHWEPEQRLPSWGRELAR